MMLETIAEGLEFPEGPIALADGSVILCEIAGQRVTHVAPDGGTRVLGEVPGGPNGLALGPDGQIYICNNGAGFGFERTNGITRPSAPATNYSGGRIERLDPETGRLVELYREVDTIPMPDPLPTNIAFGSADMRTAFITLSGAGRLVKARWPRPGLRLNYQDTAV